MIRSARPNRSPFITGINITPLTDVCLVLLIIFMVTASALTKEAGINMRLPQSTSADIAMPVSLTIHIARNQSIMLNDQRSSMATLTSDIRRHRQQFGTQLVVVKADEAVPYQWVVTAIDGARRAGVSQIALATRRVDTDVSAQRP